MTEASKPSPQMTVIASRKSVMKLEGIFLEDSPTAQIGASGK